MSKQLEEYAKEWKEFLEFREKKIALNMLSPEYKKVSDDFQNSGYLSININYLFLKYEREKGAYEATFEGMLSWIADGKPVNQEQ